jgi:mRNA interferase MazF
MNGDQKKTIDFMQIFKPYSVVIVPFPFTDKDYTKKRPALVISQEEYQIYTHHCILAMITSAKQSRWNNDILIGDIEATKLPGSSVIRAKLFTLDERLILSELGILSKKDQEYLKKNWNGFLLR